MADKEDIKSVDPATIEMLEKAAQDGCNTVFERAARTSPCPIGAAGNCCSICGMGPCRVPLAKGKEETAEEKKKRRGVRGATAETIAARNFVRMIAAGTAAHGDHGRVMAKLFLDVAQGKAPGYKITDEQKLLQLALDLGVTIGDRSVEDIAVDCAKLLMAEFGKQEGELLLLKRAPIKRQELWRKLGIAPRGIDIEVTEAMHRTHMGTDQDYKDLLNFGAQVSLADGWGGSLIGTEVQDIIFGTPAPILSQINLGVLKEDEVNVIIHGHEPQLAEMMAVASRDPELIAYAKTKGANGINLAGMCCTANEMLMRHGVPIAGNFLQQELAINHLHDVSSAVQQCVEDAGFSVVRDLVGHGIGKQLHEEPPIPNFGVAGTGILLKEGMTLAIEPMVNAGTFKVEVDADGWTVRTADGKPSAHFEHTIVVRQGEPEILTR